jgi:acetyltransferase-like isoleucine patch superfamily enzyme
MAYLTQKELEGLGLKFLGQNVKISDKACIYDASTLTIGNESRIDDFCIVSGKVDIGEYVHITPMCLIAGGKPGIILSDFCTLAYGGKIFSQSDDYSGESMVNSLIDAKYKSEVFLQVILEKQVIVGTNSVIFPGVIVAEGCALGAMTLLNKSTEPWGVYVGSPASRIKERKKNLLILEKKFLKDKTSDCI